MKYRIWAAAGLFLAACGGGRPVADPTVAPAAPSGPLETASPQEVNSLWTRAEAAVRQGKWGDAEQLLERVLLEFGPGDPRISQAHFWLGESYFARGRQLEAAREFRKASDDTPNHPIAPEALLRVGDVYADLWRRPELDPTYGQTALATYQELLNRYPATDAAKRAQLRINELNERFAYKSYRAAMFYYRLKAYDSAILYLKDLIANYPKSAVAPNALVKLVQSYKALGYREDVQETCDYLRRFHPRAPEAGEVCPTGSTGA
ncbi:MAG TPA: outer membrane protein assembly factor BamD [Gemmatimonadales bacterium]|nr:outer membrane protein assembly factor BamD [Gemmatimonadales bacterium]